MISAALGTRLPGAGAIYVSQSLRFLKPVYPGDTVTATVEVTVWQEDRGMVTLRTTCANQSGDAIIDGEAVLLVAR
jgi:acyl dehydratase